MARWFVRKQSLSAPQKIGNSHNLHLTTFGPNHSRVSEGQFRGMREVEVQLVVPAGLHKAYPKTVRPHLASFENFLGDVRLLNMQIRFRVIELRLFRRLQLRSLSLGLPEYAFCPAKVSPPLAG
jgi:hypothetical protein